MLGDETIGTARAAVPQEVHPDVCRNGSFFGNSSPSLPVVDIRQYADFVPEGNAADGGPPDAGLGAAKGIACITDNENFHEG